MRRTSLLVLVPVWSVAAFGQDVPRYSDFLNRSSARQPLRYLVDNRASSPLAEGPMQAAVASAWNTWNAVSCAVPKAEFAGFTTNTVSRPSDTYDVFNVTPVWISSQNDPDAANALGQFTMAASFPLSYAGIMQACDVWLNATLVRWSVLPTTPSTDVDLESVMLHEVGHCLGLEHNSAFMNSVMQNPMLPGAQRRSLLSADAPDLCHRYPLTGAVGAPCLADGGCGGVAGLACIRQDGGTAGVTQYCTRGCAPGTGSACEFPLSCEASVLFSPAAAGACFLPVSTQNQIGKACGAAVECGSAVAECFPVGQQPSGLARWADGYCAQGCEPGQEACPVGSTCTAFSDQTQHCLKSCRVGSAECRYGYACAPVADGGVCLPRCYADPDCVDAARFQCRICDGLCVPKQSPSGQVGDPCSADATCGAGQRCVKTDPRFAQRSCTEPCGSGCGNCPTGSSCHVLAGGALYCLKTCTGLHTCPTGMRCEDLSAGKACMPGCLGAGDCAADEDCVAGECVAPEDPGCGASCEPVDAGKPTGGKKDAGSGGGGGTASTGGGCGCGASPASLPWIWMPLTCFALSLVAQRRRLRVRA